MFRKIGSLIPHRPIDHKNRPLTADQTTLLNIFSQNLNLYKKISTDSERIQLFETLLAQFKDTFDSVSHDQLQNPKIVDSIDQYCVICSSIGANICSNLECSKKLFDSIFFIFHLFSKLPHETDFIALFIGIILEAGKSPEVLKPAYDVFTLMFTNSPNFYHAFIESDGYTILFSTIFMKDISQELQLFFNKLLFESIPPVFHSIAPSSDILSLFSEFFSSNESKIPNLLTARFISNYLLIFQKVDVSLFYKFNELNGFAFLNKYYLRYFHEIEDENSSLQAQEEVVEFYKKLLIASDADPCIITSLYKLYRDENVPLTLRSLIIKLLSLTINDVFSFDKVNQIVPIHLWILFPPELDQEGLIHLTIFLKFLSESRKYCIKSSLDAILQIIQPPGEIAAPIDSFLELIETAINQRELLPEELLNKKFLEDFILIPSHEDVARYFENHPLFGSVVASVYSSELANDYRFPVIQKFIETSKFLKDMKDFIDFLSTLFKRHFSAQIVSLLLNFMENKDLKDLLIKELTKRQCGYQYFLESNGFLSLDDFLKDHDDRGEDVVRILAAISQYGPKREVNDWINNQPSDSPIYKTDKRILSEALYAFKKETSFLHIPSFLPFTDDFDYTSQMNLYLAGKYGIPSYHKFDIPIHNIPHYQLIVERYVDPEDVWNFINLKYPLFNLKSPHFSVYEFIPSFENSFMTLQFYPFVCFSFNVPHISPFATTLMKSNYLTINIEADRLTCSSTENNLFSFPIESNIWHQVVLSSSPMKKKIDIFIDQKNLCSIKIDDDVSPYLFGDDKNKLGNGFFIAEPILISNKPINNFQYVWKTNPLTIPINELQSGQITRNMSVYEAKYQGIATYFSHFIDLEEIFLKMENTDDLPKFSHLYYILLNIQIINHINQNRFWDRLFLMFKRVRNLIQEDLIQFVIYTPLNLYSHSQKSHYVFHLLNDYEFFFVFNPEPLISIIKTINNYLIENKIEFENNQESSLIQSIANGLRAGINEKVSIHFISIIFTLIKLHPTDLKLKFLLNTSISACDWNASVDYSLKHFPIENIISKPLANTKIHQYLLDSFIELAKLFHNIHIYTYEQLIAFMILFDDERSFLFADLISIYSHHNPSFIKESQKSSCFAFSRQCESIGCWIRAFAILSGQISGDIFPTQLTIERPVFLPVIIEMLSSLCQRIAISALNPEVELTTGKMVSDIFDILMTIPKEQYNYFLQKSCKIPLMVLANLGMFPTSIQTPNGRKLNDWIEGAQSLLGSPSSSVININVSALNSNTIFQSSGNINVSLSSSSISNLSLSHSVINREKLKKFLSLSDKCLPFTHLIHNYIFDKLNSKEIFNSHNLNFKNMFLRYSNDLPFDIENTDFLTKIPFTTSLLNLFTTIAFQSDSSNFADLIFEYVIGHSLMYTRYSHAFGQDLIFSIISKISENMHFQNDFYRPLFRLISKCIKNGVFNDKYIHLLSLIFNIMKKLHIEGNFQSILNDSFIVKTYREILLCSFAFLSGNKDDTLELFQLFILNKEVIFDEIVFKNNEFALIWIYIMNRIEEKNNPEIIKCIEMTMNIYNRFITNEYKEEEIEEIWKSLMQKFRNTKTENRKSFDRGQIIVKEAQTNYKVASEEHLIVSLFRASNLFIQSNSQLFALNSRNRNYEFSMYQMCSVSRCFYLQKNYVPKSFHLALNSFPMHQSKAVSPSPYELKSPKFKEKMDSKFLAVNDGYVSPSRIQQIELHGKIAYSPEWHHFNTNIIINNGNEETPSDKMFISPFEYSQFLSQRDHQHIPHFKSIFHNYGTFTSFTNCYFFYFTHKIPSVIITSEHAAFLILLAQYKKNDLSFIPQPEWPIAYLPLIESITLNEWHHTSLFCGHIIIIYDLERIVRVRQHLYLHKPLGITISSMFDPQSIILFNSTAEAEIVREMLTKVPIRSIVKELPNYPFLFSISKVSDAIIKWSNNLISNFDYLLLLNDFGGRSFMDTTQYPVFPWVCSPAKLLDRDLSLPMGQLDKERAKHYDETYENSFPTKYFYGFHYSPPAVVFWLLFRLPPFTFFLWELNNGWDDSQRLFTSVSEAYEQASSTSRTDLKELNPAMYSIPEAYINSSSLAFSEEASEHIVLPDWAENNPCKYVDVMRKKLETSEKLNEWIDLIFGCKQTGDLALQSKNIFLPTSYHTSTAESIEMDEAQFETQVNDFGQCPIQLFLKPHPKRINKLQISIISFEGKIDIESVVALNSLSAGKTIALCDIGTYLLHGLAKPIPPRFYHCIILDSINSNLQICSIAERKPIYFVNKPKFAFTSDISISSDGLFAAFSNLNGFVEIVRIVHQLKKPVNFETIGLFSQKYSCIKSSIFSNDFICASLYKVKDAEVSYRIYLWNYTTNTIHRIIYSEFEVIGMLADDSEGILTIYGKHEIAQYTINGIKLRYSKTPLDYDITVAVLYTPNFCFDGHLIVTGDTRGYLTFYQANENSYDSFLQIGVKAAHKHPIVSLFVFNARSQIASLDTRGNTFITYIDTSIDEETIIQQDLEQLDQNINEEELKELESDQVQDHNTKKEEEEHNRASRKQKRAALCALCDNESITTCSVCGVPLCNNCLITEGNKNYCPNCIGDASEVIEDESFE